ncbi:hypothetical protein K435DRAFT_792764 [Dendrothele bispora CBS 962.96]|uniref:Apple domain-containing protein n=1 Tax=Dendrothele bispora (strain CBS 962.96) TaxID=1314807 RepID=A0A4S8MHT5_DENBC|nr:hypothetical protein K435DRAFT_792764 [Dendrothele bispora CBS 962.96]
MFSLTRLATVAALAVSFAKGSLVLREDGVMTDMDSILAAASTVDQKSGPAADDPPQLPPPTTSVTILDGTPINSTVDAVAADGVTLNRRSRARRSHRGLLKHRRELARRDSDFSPDPRYEQVFGDNGDDHDGSIQGTAYLTYTVVDNSTYNVLDCLQFCDRVKDCVFVNLYYEFNNPLLDFVFSEHSNLKCAAYGDRHIAVEKTNQGGQQLEDPPAGLSYITHSTGWALKNPPEPAVPQGYSKMFGPSNGANNADGYMGFVFLDRYDVQACANLCDARDPDPHGGRCKFFNIWRAEIDQKPTTYTCSMYTEITDESTAVNSGQGSLLVTNSRGYALTKALPQSCNLQK